MKFRAALALVLLGTLALLTPLAYAMPADPSWIAGVYDDADLDAIVGLITSESGLVEPLGTPDLAPLAAGVLAAAVGNDEDPALSPSYPGDAIRAPPAS